MEITMSKIVGLKLSKTDLKRLVGNTRTIRDIPHNISFLNDNGFDTLMHFFSRKVRGINFEISENKVSSFYLRSNNWKGRASKSIDISRDCQCLHPDEDSLVFDPNNWTSLGDVIDKKEEYYFEFWNNPREYEIPQFVFFELSGIENLIDNFEHFILSGSSGISGVGVKQIKSYASLKLEGFPANENKNRNVKIINTLMGLPCPPSWGKSQ